MFPKKQHTWKWQYRPFVEQFWMLVEQHLVRNRSFHGTWLIELGIGVFSDWRSRGHCFCICPLRGYCEKWSHRNHTCGCCTILPRTLDHPNVQRYQNHSVCHFSIRPCTFRSHWHQAVHPAGAEKENQI